MYSQRNEEEIILNHFGDRMGRLLDLGAADGLTFSNSRALLEKGWTGVLVEGEFGSYQQLCRLYKDNPKVVCENLVLDLVCHYTEFYCSGEQINSLDEKLLHQYGYQKPSKRLVVTTRIAEWIMKQGKFDFVTMDLDGSNWPLFTNTPHRFWKDVELICIEHENRQESIKQLLEISHRELARTAENLLMVKK